MFFAHSSLLGATEDVCTFQLWTLASPHHQPLPCNPAPEQPHSENTRRPAMHDAQPARCYASLPPAAWDPCNSATLTPLQHRPLPMTQLKAPPAPSAATAVPNLHSNFLPPKPPNPPFPPLSCAAPPLILRGPYQRGRLGCSARGGLARHPTTHTAELASSSRSWAGSCARASRAVRYLAAPAHVPPCFAVRVVALFIVIQASRTECI